MVQMDRLEAPAESARPAAGSTGAHSGPGADGKDRCRAVSVRELSQAFALAVPDPETAIRIREDVALFQAVQSVLVKRAAAAARPEEELDHAMCARLVSRAVASEGVVDIFAAAGLDKPDISILSDGVPRRSAGNAAPEPGGRAAEEAAEGRTRRSPAKEPRPGAILRRDARTDPPPLRRTGPSRRLR